MSKIKAVVFDWNGVIVDSFALDHLLFLDSSKSLEIKVDKSKKFYKTLYQGDVFKKLLAIGFTEEHLNNTGEYRKVYKKNIHMSKPFPKIKNILKKLKKKYVIGLVTANFSDIVEYWIEKNSFHGIFNFILTSDHSRNKEENIQTFLDKFKISKEEVLYVGDTIADIEVCKNSGIKIIVDTWGYNNEKELKEYKPDFIARKPEDLVKILGRLDG